MTCSTCIHFLSRGVPDAAAEPKSQAADGGVCRRYPPRVFQPQWDDLGLVTVTSVFPATHQDQSCGEYASSEIQALLQQSERYRRPNPEAPLC